MGGVTSDMLSPQARQEINRTLHTALGLCWHEFEFKHDGWVGRNRYRCRHCQEGSYFGLPDLPDYCTDLGQVSRAEALVSERFGSAVYGSVLGDMIELDMGEGAAVEPQALKIAVARAACATAFERALACVSLLTVPAEKGE